MLRPSERISFDRVSGPRAFRCPSPVLVCPTLHFPGRRFVVVLVCVSVGPRLGADARGRLATAPGARDAALGASQPRSRFLGPISMTINISMNNGDSDAMDKRLHLHQLEITRSSVVSAHTRLLARASTPEKICLPPVLASSYFNLDCFCWPFLRSLKGIYGLQSPRIFR